MTSARSCRSAKFPPSVASRAIYRALRAAEHLPEARPPFRLADVFKLDTARRKKAAR